MKTTCRLVSLHVLLLMILVCHLSVAAVITRISVDSAGLQAAGASGIDGGPSISADGRFIAFESSASNLVAGDTNNWQDIFLRDTETGKTTRVSVAAGGIQANRASQNPCISADGRYIAFESTATNLVAGDTNNACDIFIFDTQTSQTSRASILADGTQANGSSFHPVLSGDGQYVAFVSMASNLVAGDTNNAADVFVLNRQSGAITRMSVATGGAQADWASQAPSISSDGRYIAFESLASNLVAGDTNDTWDVFVHDRQTAQTIRVSVSTANAQGDACSSAPSISADGRFVAFESLAGNLVSGDSNGASDIFVRDLQSLTTLCASLAVGGAQANGDSLRPAVSGDGNIVAFESYADNLVPGDTNGWRDVFVHDRTLLQTSRISVATDGTQASDESGGWNLTSASLVNNGRLVAFASNAGNLTAGDSNGVWDVFAYDYRDQLPAPTFTPDGGILTEETSVMIQCGIAGVDIHYTTDGSTPTINSPLYQSGVTINTNLTLKAAAWKSGWMPSSVKSADYIYAGPTEFESTTGLIRPGWNLVSVPADPINADPLVVFSSIDVPNASFQFWRNEMNGGGYQSYGAMFGWTGPVVRGIPYWFIETTTGKTIRFTGTPPTADFEMVIPARQSAPYWMMFATPFPVITPSDNIRFKNILKRGDVWLTWEDAYSPTNASLRMVDSNAQGWASSISGYVTVTPSTWVGRHQFDPWWGYWLLVYDNNELRVKILKP